jgi:hypothetical protein
MLWTLTSFEISRSEPKGELPGKKDRTPLLSSFLCKHISEVSRSVVLFATRESSYVNEDQKGLGGANGK